jgi:hypothetical protein
MKANNTLNTEESLKRLAKLDAIFKELNLSSYHLTNIKAFNSTQPYHNYQHMITVAINCYEAGVQYQLAPHALRMLVIAALYHDIDHTGNGIIPDAVNIEKAVALTEVLLISEIEPTVTPQEIIKIQNLIRSTETGTGKTPATLLEQIIHDSDLLQSTEEDHEQWFTALTQETGYLVNIETTIEWYKTQKLYTTWGQNRLATWLTKVDLR